MPNLGDVAPERCEVCGDRPVVYTRKLDADRFLGEDGFAPSEALFVWKCQRCGLVQSRAFDEAQSKRRVIVVPAAATLGELRALSLYLEASGAMTVEVALDGTNRRIPREIIWSGGPTVEQALHQHPTFKS